MQEHDTAYDKHGNEVSGFVTEAVGALRDHPDVAKVLCDYYRSGRLQVWSYRKAMDGDVIMTAVEHGYEPDFVKERTFGVPGTRDAAGYAEFTPAENK